MTSNAVYDCMSQKTCHKCHPECDGCHGGMPTDCNKCRNYNQTTSKQPNKYECVSNCSYYDGYYDAGNRVCQPCDSQCKLCHGPTKYDCPLCLNVRIHSGPDDVETLGNDTGSSKACVLRTSPRFRMIYFINFKILGSLIDIKLM